MNDTLQASENSQSMPHIDKRTDVVHKEENLADGSQLRRGLSVPSIVGFAVPTEVPAQIPGSHSLEDTAAMMTDLSMPATAAPQSSPSDLAISTQSRSRRHSVSSNPSLQIFLDTRHESQANWQSETQFQSVSPRAGRIRASMPIDLSTQLVYVHNLF